MPRSIELIEPYPTLHTNHTNHNEEAQKPPHQFPILETATSYVSRADYSFPEGGTQAWLVILGSFCIICGTFGLISSVGLFQSYWQANQLSAYSTRDLGWIGAVNVFLTLLLGVQIGPLFDAYGPRWLILSGSVALVVGIVLLAECKVYWHFILCYGVLIGSASACLTTTALSVVAHCKSFTFFSRGSI